METKQTCHNCGNESVDLTMVNGKNYCEDCFNSKFTECEDCGGFFPKREIFHSSVTECEYCERCYSDRFTTCDRCGDECEREEASFIGDDLYCRYCYENHTYYCEHCEESFDNNNPCDCNNDESDGIHDHSYKPEPVFFGNDKLFMGIELEVENIDRKNEDDLLEDIESELWYYKRDGSLDNGFEIVTHPMSFDVISKHPDFNKLFALKKQGVRSYDTNTCGMHIHVNRNYFTTLEIFKILYFISHNKGFVTKISQRKQENLNRWASLRYDSNRDIIEVTKNGNPNRYVALNLQNRHTIEFRIFRGTLKSASFFKNVQFVHALCQWVKVTSLKRLTWQNFKSFVSDKKEYINLIEFLNKRQEVSECV